MKLGPLDFRQPSTWRGLLGLLALGGWALSPALRDQIALALATALSAIELFRDEYAARKAPLPPIELQSPAAPAPPPAEPERLRALPPHPESSLPPGFGDR
jgi:uncharacterized protein YciW